MSLLQEPRLHLVVPGAQTPAVHAGAPTFRDAGRAGASPGGSDWMAALDGDLRLDQLTLPGSHDAGARHGGRWIACQHLPIAGQLSLGIRYLDVRVRLRGSRFGIHHGHVFQKLTLDEVLESCRDFLSAHPTETVMVCLTQEFRRCDVGQVAREWARLRARFSGLLLDARRVPRLANARGRVVVVTRDPGFEGLEHASWQVHDQWRVDTRADWLARKWPAVTDHLRRARAARGDGRVWACHATSTGWALAPSAAADLLRPRLATHFDELGERSGGLPERNGVVLLDFPDHALVTRIWRRNL